MKAETQKSVFHGIKYILIVYALLSLIYTTTRLYQQVDSPSLIMTATRRSIVIEEPVNQKSMTRKGRVTIVV